MLTMLLRECGPDSATPAENNASAAAPRKNAGPEIKQCSRRHRRAFKIQPVPIQTNETIQANAATRTDEAKNSRYANTQGKTPPNEAHTRPPHPVVPSFIHWPRYVRCLVCSQLRNRVTHTSPCQGGTFSFARIRSCAGEASRNFKLAGECTYQGSKGASNPLSARIFCPVGERMNMARREASGRAVVSTTMP